MRDIVITIVIAVLIIFIFNGRYKGNEPTIVTHTDTIYKHDITKKYIKGDSIPFVVLDTLYQIDEVHATTKYQSVFGWAVQGRA